jgi:hypothetical protein
MKGLYRACLLLMFVSTFLCAMDHDPDLEEQARINQLLRQQEQLPLQHNSSQRAVLEYDYYIYRAGLPTK